MVNKEKKEAKPEIRIIKEKKKIKVVKGDENLARSWLMQSENNFRERLTQLDERRTRRLENVSPVAVEAPAQRIVNNLPPARISTEKRDKDESKYSVKNEDPLAKKYFTENSPTFYSAGKVDVTRVGREKNEFNQEAFSRRAEGDVGKGNRFDSYVTPSGVDTMSLGRKDPMKRDEPAYRSKLPTS